MSSPAPSYFSPKYCSICDEYFMSKETLQYHIQSSSRHPRCTTCKRNYLNMNSLRNHYVYSSRHHYCRACEKSFKTAAGFRVHLEQSAFHNGDTDDVDDNDGRPPGWEDEVAQQQQEAERLDQTEEEINFDEESSNGVTSMDRRIGLLKLRARMKTRKITPIFSYTCPICLSSPGGSASATRCGHVFCTPCIGRVVEHSGICPTCRKPATFPQLRTIDLHAY